MNKIATTPIQTKPDLIASDLEKLFAPRGVAVIGASPKSGNQGRRIVESLHAQGFEGCVTTVHPKGMSLPGCDSVTHIENLPEITELAIAAVSAKQVLPLLEPLAHKGIHHLIVISGGFEETGEAGKFLQDELKRLAKKFGVRILGPNCLGTFSAPDRFNSFFLSPQEIRMPKAGSVAMISQSGAFLSNTLDQLATRGIGVHRAINFGNGIDIGTCESLQAFSADPAIQVIGIYLESLQNGRRFFELARRIASTKPIVVCKGGKAEQGNRAIQAHSASLSGSYSIFQAACEQSGMVEVNGLGELINALHVLALVSIPKGNRTLIVSNAGGMGVLLTDLCERKACDVTKTPLNMQQELQQSLPGYFSFKNPIDLTGSGTNDQCRLVLEKILQKDLYHCLLLVVLPGTDGIDAEIASRLRDILPKSFPAIIGAYGKELYSKLCSAFHQEGIPVFPSGEEAAWAVNLLVKMFHSRLKSHGIPIQPCQTQLSLPVIKKSDDHSGNLDEMQLKTFLAEGGVDVPMHLPVINQDDLYRAIRNLGFPVVLKVVGSELRHKTEHQGIQTDIFNTKDLLREWKRMSQRWPGQIWVEEQMPSGLDLMIGVHRDSNFGPVLLFGTGGSYVEIYQDIQRLLLPATLSEIYRLIIRTRAGQIIRGVRGQPPLELEKLLRFIQGIAEWFEKQQNILSLDFNPVRLYGNSLVVLDAKMTTENNIKGSENHEHSLYR